MKNLETFGVEELSFTQAQNTEGGILLGIGGLLYKALEFVVGEVGDFIDGAKDGFKATTGI